MENEDGSIQVASTAKSTTLPRSKRNAAEGPRFKGHSDTEVIVHGYEEYGLNVVSKSGGCSRSAMDAKKKQMFLVRDASASSRLLLSGRQEIRLRVRDQGDPRGPFDPARAEPAGAVRVPRFRVRAGAGDDVQAHLQTAGGHYLLWKDGRAKSSATGTSRSPPGRLPHVAAK